MFAAVVNATVALKCPLLLMCHVTLFTWPFIPEDSGLPLDTVPQVDTADTFSSLADPSVVCMTPVQSTVYIVSLVWLFSPPTCWIPIPKHSMVVISTILYLSTVLCLEDPRLGF